MTVDLIAVWAWLRFNAARLGRTAHAIFTVTRRHVPRWVGVVLTACLFIPGPLDELLVLIAIGVLVAVKPVMRRDLILSVAAAWRLA